MRRTGLLPALCLRLSELADGLAELGQRIAGADEPVRRQFEARSMELAQRWRELEGRVRSLERSGVRIRSEADAELRNLACILTDEVADLSRLLAGPRKPPWGGEHGHQ